MGNVFWVVLEYDTMLPPHALSQIETNLIIELDALVQSEVGIPIIVKPVFLSPSLEQLCG